MREGCQGEFLAEFVFAIDIALVALRGTGRLSRSWPGFRFADLTLFFQSVNDKRADLYNKLVASYHKAKTERADLARELEAARGFFLLCLADALILPACSCCR